MRISKPAYFDSFRCIASLCPDSCCKEWDVDVDPEATGRYLALEGALGDRLRQVLQRREDGSGTMTIIDGRCPMWREDGLCRIQAELGHEALCHTCREFPRLTHDYGNFVEYGLELSCPEAARIIFHAPPLPFTVTDGPGEEAPEYDEEAMEILLKTRQEALEFLASPGCTVPEALAVLLLYGYQVQEELDGAKMQPLDVQQTLADARRFIPEGPTEALWDFFLGLEILTPGWRAMLEQPGPGADWAPEHLALARYFVERYWLQAVADYDLVCRVKLAVISCLLVRNLGGQIDQTAQLYSKEIENSLENVEALLDGAYTDPALTDRNLLGLLLG